MSIPETDNYQHLVTLWGYCDVTIKHVIEVSTDKRKPIALGVKYDEIPLERIYVNKVHYFWNIAWFLQSDTWLTTIIYSSDYFLFVP